ncbi:MAG: hypothetical protein A3F16_02925 [Deltaproteobacteria bacterium RIFCSPHIGHO2_12_FULL_43_9]|nr:MAG: hypothetical protein A3F16_02925 [Deltaproteobacteria bacterium RIFCSPHIGHO2_12_FULL_43_9]
MKGLKIFSIVALLAGFLVGAQQCSTPVVENVRLELTTSKVALRADFDDSVMIDIGGRFLIPDLEGGYIEIIPGGGGAGSRNAGIAFGVDLSQYSRQFPIAPVDSLPNGIPFPGTVEGPLLAWTIDAEANRTLVAYIGLQTGEIGFTAQLEAFDEILLPGSLITIVYRDEETNEIVADVTLYGPQQDIRGDVTRSGGVFVHAFVPAEFLPGGAYFGHEYVIDTAGTYIEVIQ